MMKQRYEAVYREWAARMAVWEDSGLSGAEFCRREGIPQWKFYGWRGRLSRARAASSAEGGFVPLSFSGEDQGCGIALWLNGVRLELSRGFDPVELSKAVKALAGFRC
jgi:hypothetical protein